MQTPHLILKNALAGPDPLLAAEAARLIGEWHGTSFIPDLIGNIRVSRFYSKVASIYALVRLSAVEAVPCLESLLDHPNVPDDFYWNGYKGVRAAAAVALLQFGNTAGLAYLHELADKKDDLFFRWFAPALIRQKTAPDLQNRLSLENLCTRSQRDAYTPASYSEPAMLCMLCEALGLLPDPGADEHLELYMNFHSRYVRGQAYRSLYLRHPDEDMARKISNHAAKYNTDFDLLVSAGVRRDSGVLLNIAARAESGFDRGSAIDSLKAISSPDACETGLEDNDPHVRKCAVERLAGSQTANAKQRLAQMTGTEKDPGVLCALAATMLEERDPSC